MTSQDSPDATSQNGTSVRTTVRAFARVGRIPVLSAFEFARGVTNVIREPAYRPIFVAAAMTLLGGTMLFRWIEGWSFLDALYFSVLTLTTVGYGDITPETQLGRAVNIAFILIGVGVIGLFITTIIEHARSRVDALNGETRGVPSPPPFRTGTARSPRRVIVTRPIGLRSSRRRTP